MLLGRESGVLPVGTREELTEFDQDFDAYHPHNRAVAKALGIEFDPKLQQYVDVYGFPVRDRFGQLL